MPNAGGAAKKLGPAPVPKHVLEITRVQHVFREASDAHKLSLGCDSSEPQRRSPSSDEPFVDIEEGANEPFDEPGEPVNTDEINRLKNKIMHLQEEAMEKPKAERRAARAEIQQLQEELEMQLQGYSEYRSMGASPPPSRPPAPCP